MRCPELAVQECLTLGEIMVVFCSDFQGRTCLWPNKGARKISEARTNMRNHGMNPHGCIPECNSEQNLR